MIQLIIFFHGGYTLFSPWFTICLRRCLPSICRKTMNILCASAESCKLFVLCLPTLMYANDGDMALRITMVNTKIECVNQGIIMKRQANI
ncbi:hypothetical protein QVD17_19873 [Tagetes erecta]|uniref:Uncharacterized protein n=1 Tax=Tagetes erecta TaxID=13708 RepID=A0AAD8KKL9_TARER|nr:hypothetical protein QVD17_19873 [Tagetes erecta]